VSLDCRPEDTQSNLIVLESGQVSAKRSVLQRYRNRLVDTDNGNDALRDLSLFQCLRFWDWMIWKLRPRAKPRVINYFPRYKNDPRIEAYSDYCRVRLMLHHPFVDWDDLLSVEGQVYASYIDAFRACTQQHVHPEDFYTDLEELEGLGSDSDTDSDDSSDEDEDNNYPLAGFEILARRRPRDDFPRVDVSEGLSYRDIDRDFNWPMFFARYNHPSSILDQVRAENPVNQVVNATSSPRGLNTEQRKLYDTVVDQYTRELAVDQPEPSQLLLQVDGAGGVGKTVALLRACARLQELATMNGKQNPVFRS
jgi:ATP-dependent DNA helicase PIF1